MKQITQNQIAEWEKKFKSILESARSEEPDDESVLGTWIIPLERIGDNDWAIVVAWQDGFYEENLVIKGGWDLCAKVAYQPKNSIMQCDYDVDWMMPYNERTGEIDDTDISLVLKKRDESNFKWLIENWTRIRRGALLKELSDEFLSSGYDEYDFYCEAASQGFTLEDFKSCLVDGYDGAYEFCKTHSCGFPDEPNNN